MIRSVYTNLASSDVPYSHTTDTGAREGAWLETKAGVEGDAVALGWLVSALDYARARGQNQSVEYLETIVDDVHFETEMAARRAALLSGVK
jgi:hypothetical protein